MSWKLFLALLVCPTLLLGCKHRGRLRPVAEAEDSRPLSLQLGGANEALSFTEPSYHYRPNILSQLDSREISLWSGKGFSLLDFDSHNHLYTAAGQQTAPPPPCFSVAFAPLPRLGRYFLVTAYEDAAIENLANFRYCSNGVITAANQEAADKFRAYHRDKLTAPSLSLTGGVKVVKVVEAVEAVEAVVERSPLGREVVEGAIPPHGPPHAVAPDPIAAARQDLEGRAEDAPNPEGEEEALDESSISLMWEGDAREAPAVVEGAITHGPPHAAAGELSEEIIAAAATGRALAESHAAAPLTAEQYRDFVNAAAAAQLDSGAEHWTAVLQQLENCAHHPLTEPQKKLLNAVERQTLHSLSKVSSLSAAEQKSLGRLRESLAARQDLEGRAKDASKPEGEEKPLDQDVLDRQTIETAYFRLQQMARATQVVAQPTTAERIEEYLRDSSILLMWKGYERETLAKSIGAGLKRYVKAKGRWPSMDELAAREQFYWNLNFGGSDFRIMVEELFASTRTLEWKNFVNYDYPIKWRDYDIEVIKFLFYKNFPNPGDERIFLDFFPPRTFASVNEYLKLMKLYQVVFLHDETLLKKFSQLWQRNPKNFYREQNKLLRIYDAFPEELQWSKFIESQNSGSWWSKMWSAGLEFEIIQYQNFAADKAEIKRFMEYYRGLDLRESEYVPEEKMLEKFAPEYKRLKEAGKLAEFSQWMKGFKGIRRNSSYSEYINDAAIMVKMYLDFPLAQRESFFRWAEKKIGDGRLDSASYVWHFERLEQLMKLYLASPGTEFFLPKILVFGRVHFSFPEELFLREKSDELGGRMKEFLEFYSDPLVAEMSIEQKYSLFIDDEVKKSFSSFEAKYPLAQPDNPSSRARTFLQPWRFFDRSYLIEERKLAAYIAMTGEKSEIPPERLMSLTHELSEARLAGYLPVIDSDDGISRGLAGAAQMEKEKVANAHKLEKVYHEELPILTQVTEQKYTGQRGKRPLLLYNNTAEPLEYHTTVEVEEFLTYLEELETAARNSEEAGSPSPTISSEGKVLRLVEAITTIKKMLLGIDKKALSVRSDFPPYLNASWLYAEPLGTPTSHLGEELLGKVWLRMKQLDAEDTTSGQRDTYRRSMLIALLNTAELDGARIDLRCQTRITGELLIALAPSLPGSKLRRHVGMDLKPTGEAADMKLRIAEAPARGEAIFMGIFQDAERWGNRELFRVYRTFYDGLYRRTPVEDAAGHITYLHDEHMLERDSSGNVVSNYDASGALRQTPQIAYYQSEFMVLEMAFNQMLKRFFEEKRVLYWGSP